LTVGSASFQIFNLAKASLCKSSICVVGSSHYKSNYYTKRQAFDNNYFCISKITKIKNFLFYLTRSQTRKKCNLQKQQATLL